MGTRRYIGIAVSIPMFLFAFVALAAAPVKPTPSQVKVAAVQMLGYDKTDVPRPGFEPSDAVVRYIERAARDGAQLAVFPEYLLGRISVPGPQTEQISKAAVAGRICVIVGCWEVYEDGSFANTALLFDRTGKIVGKYHKVHAAVDHFDGEPPWSKPPKGKDTDWFIRNDPEWAMKRGEGFPVFDLDFGRTNQFFRNLRFGRRGAGFLAPNIGMHQHSHNQECGHGSQAFHRGLLVKSVTDTSCGSEKR